MPKYHVNDKIIINDTSVTIVSITTGGYYFAMNDEARKTFTTDGVLDDLIWYGARYVPAETAEDLPVGTVLEIGGGSYTKCEPGVWIETTVVAPGFEYVPYTSTEVEHLLRRYEYRVIFDPRNK